MTVATENNSAPGTRSLSSSGEGTAPRQPARSRLFGKYVGLFVVVVSLALLANGIVDVWFYYREHKSALVRIQREQAEAASAKIGQFVAEIESQLGWTTQLPWSTGTVEQRRFDALRLLRQVPAITEISQLDATGKERLRVSRLAMDVIGSNTDYSQEPKFKEAVSNKVYYGPVYFRRESEPYMTLAINGTRKDAGVSVAEVNLKLIWDVVSQIRVGQKGQAYVVDDQGRLIAHPDISLVLRNTDMSKLEQVRAASAGSTEDIDVTEPVQNIQGQSVLTAHAPVPKLGWQVFVELPAEEANAPLYAAVKRLALILLAALIFAILAGMFLARRMVGPIRELQIGAARIGSGDLSHRLSVKTGDELETLADQFNEMAKRLEESYAGLEQKVAQRTAELSKSLHELRTAQDRLVQTEKLASLGQLTAGIAHEIKNPLNFVNNFSAISSELLDELQGAVKQAKLEPAVAAEVVDLAEMLRGNLEKIVQHGKRADSIVKNMLLHSRAGAGEHRPANINSIVEESLNLAYHGARAEKPGFNITLDKSYDTTAGEIDLFPQEMTRVFLNLISNGFYAATNRNDAVNGFEPRLFVATKNMGDRVEIRIRDNGAGISPEVRDKMFNPFFTTKPAGEGTGLGLSISHDIIVKQHAGTIEVDTNPDEFTEFRITLPRDAAASHERSGV
jgi:two-component system NtrC family sensor kinase